MENSYPSLDVVPSTSVGPFLLGMSLRQILCYIQDNKLNYQTAEFKFSETNPLAVDYLVSLPKYGLILKFDSSCQRLKCIVINDITKSKISFKKMEISNPEHVPNLKRIVDIFGMEKRYFNGNVYELEYTGLAMEFKTQGNSSFDENSMELPLPLSKIMVFAGAHHKTPCILKNPLLREKVVTKGKTKPTEDFTMEGYTENLEQTDFTDVKVDVNGNLHLLKNSQILHFGQTAQEILTILGAPEDIMIKSKHSVFIQTQANKGSSRYLDYFYNYFSLGIDILFDGLSHTVKKYILHSNFPNHIDFNRYEKCQFILETVSQSDLEDLDADSEIVEEKQPEDCIGDLLHVPELAPRRKTIPQNKKKVIKPEMTWEEIRNILSKTETHSVVLPTNKNDPFGKRIAQGHGNIIFEIMSNDHVASVTIFDPKA